MKRKIAYLMENSSMNHTTANSCVFVAKYTNWTNTVSGGHKQITMIAEVYEKKESLPTK